MRSDGREAGVALVTVILASFTVLLIVVWLVQEASVQYADAQRGRWEDVTVAGTEAILDRYAAKLTIDPAYYLHWVDEAEMPRKCLTTGTAITGQTIQPGNAWNSKCTSWAYYSSATTNSACESTSAATSGTLLGTGWYKHPLLGGGQAGTVDDVESRVQVCPPGTATPLTVKVASRQTGRSVDRVISAAVRAVALSEFFRVTQEDLSYGSGADLYGKVYSGDDLSFSGSPKPKARRNVYAEGGISSTSTVDFLEGAKGFDVDSGTSYGNIRDVFPQPLNFNKFWTDLDTLKAAACSGNGVCLTDSSARAWLIHPYVSGGEGKLRIYRSTHNPSSSSCVNSEEWWWLNSRSSSANWTLHSDIDVPANGVVWADNHIVVGKHDWGLNYARVRESVSLYAGTSASPKNVIVNTDVLYDDITSFDVFGLLASDELVINPNAAGGDAQMTISAAILGQTSTWQARRSCGADGNVLTPNNSTLTIKGSIATRESAGVSADFDTRNYEFDNRLEYLRPPFFPLIDDGWHYEDWKELPVPAWGK